MSHSTSAIPGSSSAEKEKEKKPRGLSRLLGKREKTPEPRPTSNLPDSAYGSSEANSADGPRGSNTPNEMMHAEKNSEIGNIDQDRNLALKPSTGEVFDEDTGEVVTVVTTTTTTTTTTTRKGGKQHQDVSKEVKEEVLPGPGNAQTGTGNAQHTLLEMPAGIPTGTTGRTPSPQPAPQPAPLLAPQLAPQIAQAPPPQPAVTSTSTGHQGVPPVPVPVPYGSFHPGDSPPVPVRSARRKSQEVPREYSFEQDPVSPVDVPVSYQGHTGTTPPASPSRHNFSYPSRVPMSGASSIRTADQPQRHNQSTVEDLRAAAKGIHGVGETLRGTLNSTIDQRFPSKNERKAAIVNARNEEVLTKGRAEMEGVPGGLPSHYGPAPEFVNEPTMEPQPTEKSGVRKLFKRKPVAQGTDIR